MRRTYRDQSVIHAKPSGVKHEFMERVNSSVCHLCLMPKNHPDHLMYQHQHSDACYDRNGNLECTVNASNHP